MADTQVDTKKAEQFAKIFGYSSQSNGQSFGPSFLHDTDKFGVGNSAFSLVTYVGKGEKITPIVLKGLLSELPEISCNVKFTEGPGKATQDMIQQLFDNKLFKFINAVGSADTTYKNMISTGALTKEMYNGIESSEFDLKFRIFPKDPMGQSSHIDWINQLSNWAIPDLSNEVRVDTAIHNLTTAIQNAKGLGTDIMAAFLTTDENLGPQDENNEQILTEDEQQAVTNSNAERVKAAMLAKTNELITLLTNRLNDMFAAQKTIRFNDRYNTELTSYSVSVNNREATNSDGGEWFWEDHARFIGTASGVDTYTGIMITFDLTFNTAGQKTFSPCIWIPLFETNKSTKGPADTKQDDSFTGVFSPPANWKELKPNEKIQISLNQEVCGKQIEKLQEQESKYNGAFKKWGPGADSLANVIRGCLEDSTKTPYDDGFAGDASKYQEGIKKVADTLKKVGEKADQIQKLGEKQYGPYRVFGNINTSNGLGEKLWHLYIYHNFLLKENEAFTVYIKSWEAIQSKEFIDSVPLYVDFNITCALDQVYSTSQLTNILSPDLISLGWPK